MFEKLIPDPQNFDLSNPNNIRLIASECNICGKRFFPQGKYCPECMSEDIGCYHMSNVGTLYSYTVVRTKSKEFNTPYAIGYVDFPENLRILAQIEDWQSGIEIGEKVKVICGVIGLDDDGAELTSYKVKAVKT